MIARALAVTAFAAGVAAAAPTKESTAANAEGQQLFRAGKYVEAIASFERAYALDADPAYLFDIAQAYRLAKECAKAVDYYDRFFQVVPDPPNAEKIRGFREASADCAKQQAPTPPLPPPPVSGPRPAPVAHVPTQILELPPPVEHDRGRGLRIGGLVTIGAGVVVTALGVYFTAHTASLDSERHALCPDLCMWTQELTESSDDLNTRGQNAHRAAIVAYSIGGVAVVGGIVMYVLGRGRDEHPIVGATPLPGGGAVMARLTF